MSELANAYAASDAACNTAALQLKRSTAHLNMTFEAPQGLAGRRVCGVEHGQYDVTTASKWRGHLGHGCRPVLRALQIVQLLLRQHPLQAETSSSMRQSMQGIIRRSSSHAMTRNSLSVLSMHMAPAAHDADDGDDGWTQLQAPAYADVCPKPQSSPAAAAAGR